MGAYVFTPKEREEIRQKLVSAARSDDAIVGAAHLGSAAVDGLDRWSDIDLALCVSLGADLEKTLADWSSRLYRDHGAVVHYDVRRGAILYRVFLLQNTLQVDLSFWPAAEFCAVGPKFELIFGEAKDARTAPSPESHDLIGMAWLYALHVRSSIARGRMLQAEYMLSGMRNEVFALACKRCGVAAVQGRGLDDLPQGFKVRAENAIPCSLESAGLRRAFGVVMEILLDEIRFENAALAAKLEKPLGAIVNSLG